MHELSTEIQLVANRLGRERRGPRVPTYRSSRTPRSGPRPRQRR
ncbi:hypothetical protein [Nocardioides rotundus]|nr:hypothetical protein [Nocardioides rotundus]